MLNKTISNLESLESILKDLKVHQASVTTFDSVTCCLSYIQSTLQKHRIEVKIGSSLLNLELGNMNLCYIDVWLSS